MIFKDTRLRKWLKNTPVHPAWIFVLRRLSPLVGALRGYVYTKSTHIDTTVIVTSYGRSGSTMLYRSLIESATSTLPRWLKKAAKGKQRDLDLIHFKPGRVHTTHHYPPQTVPPANARVVYIFADPIETVLSLLHLVHSGKWSREMFRRHCKNLQTSCDDVNELIHADKLNLEKHFDAWMSETRFPVAFVKYEHLWEHAKDVSSFVGFNVALPPRKTRTEKNVDDATMEKLKETYASLREKVANCEDFFVNNT